MKKDDRDPERKYVFPTKEAVKEEAARKSEDVKKQKGPTAAQKDGKQGKK